MGFHARLHDLRAVDRFRSVEKYITGGSRFSTWDAATEIYRSRRTGRGRKKLSLSISTHPRGFKEIVAPIFDMSNVQYLIGNFLDPSLEITGEFDFIIFSGLLYHLRYPFLGLRKAADLLKDGGMMILETAYIAELADFPYFCALSAILVHLSRPALPFSIAAASQTPLPALV